MLLCFFGDPSTMDITQIIFFFIPLLNETQKIERENVSDTLKVFDTYNKLIIKKLSQK
jgi:hypothetical protein